MAHCRENPKSLYFSNYFSYMIQMNDEILSTAPKPFVFVLMPFDKDFDDIYISGIKETVIGVSAYAERVDEQNYKEDILERIFNQINKADVIVADMTGRNPNVFYEVGYAHALGKIVLLLTQNANDIPFDLKHRQHIVYGIDGGKIQRLRTQLSPKLTWAINESNKKGKVKESKQILVSVFSYQFKNCEFVEIGEDHFSESIPSVDLELETNPKTNPISFTLRFHIYNNSSEEIPRITHIYSFAADHPIIIPMTSYVTELKNVVYTYNPEKDGKFPYKYSLNLTIPPIPPNATEAFEITYNIYKVNLHGNELKPELNRLRIHILNDYYEFSFIIKGTTKEVNCFIS